MTGRITKTVSDFYYVYTTEGNTYACKAKGIFRKEKMTPLVGDLCEIELTNTRDIEGNIISILPRKNSLIRPAVANIDQALVVFALKDPDPNLFLLDRFLVNMERTGLSSIIVFNKSDRDSEDKAFKYKNIYENAGYTCIIASVHKKSGTDEIKRTLTGKVSTVAGPSGAGKSSLINFLRGEDIMETGDISKKTKRGRQTTRHTQLVTIGKDSFIADTPGFSNADIFDVKKEELAGYFIEFLQYSNDCRFSGCAHINEPDCGVKAAVENGLIFSGRHENYIRIYNELSERGY